MTVAEDLLDAAMMLPRGELVVVDEGCLNCLLLAVKFERVPEVVKFRAIVEEWSLEDIVKEVY